MTNSKEEVNVLAEGLKIAGDLFLAPGTSLIAQADYKRGLVHVGVGLAAKVAFGVPGVVLTAANSYCTARTGEGLLSKFLSSGPTPVACQESSLRQHVYNKTAQGVDLDVIKETIAEDIEDYYHEAVSNASTSPSPVSEPKDDVETAVQSAEGEEDGSTSKDI